MAGADERDPTHPDTAGWYTWLHDHIPIEWTDDLGRTLRDIKYVSEEQDRVRLSAIRRVPDDLIPHELVVADPAYLSAWRELSDVRERFEQAEVLYDLARFRWNLAMLELASRYSPDAPVRDGRLDFSPPKKSWWARRLTSWRAE